MSADLISGESSIVCPDPRQGLLYQSPPVYDILKPCDFVFPNMIASNSASNAQITWVVQVPNKNIIVDRALAIAMDVDFTITAPIGGTTLMIPGVGDANLPTSNYTLNPDAGTPFTLGGSMGLRTNALTACTNNLNVYINQQNISTQPKYYTAAYALCMVNDDIKRGLSAQPCNPDNALTYIGYEGANDNPISGGTAYYESSRSQVTWTVTDNTVALGKINFKWIEYVMISPLQWAENMSAHSKGLVGVNQLQIIYSLADLRYLLSIDPNYYDDLHPPTVAATLHSTSVNLYVNYLTGSNEYGGIPQTIAYSVLNPVTFQTSMPDTGTPYLGTFNQTTNSIQLSSVPSKLLIYVSPADSQKSGVYPSAGPFMTDSFMSINNINITWNSMNGLLSAASPWQLWKMSVENGLQSTYYDWLYNGKSLVIIDFSKDIGLPGLAVSASGQYQLQVQVQGINYRNTTVANINIGNYIGVINLTVLTEQQLKISETQTTLEGNFDPLYLLQDLVQGKVQARIDPDYRGSMIGGAFWDRFKEYAKRNLARIQSVIPGVQHAIEVAAPYLPDSWTPYAVNANRALSGIDKLIAHLIGQGVSRKKLHDMFKGQITAREIDDIIQKHGGAIVGGAKAQKRKLHRY